MIEHILTYFIVFNIFFYKIRFLVNIDYYLLINIKYKVDALIPIELVILIFCINANWLTPQMCQELRFNL
jgi:hypothetical protein